MDLSVIVPTFDRTAELETCLPALSRQDMPRGRFEVLVIDDGSSRPPLETVAAAEAALPLRLVRAPHRGPAGARNVGAAMAKGRYLAFTDDDCCPATSWLRDRSFASNRPAITGDSSPIPSLLDRSGPFGWPGFSSSRRSRMRSALPRPWPEACRP